MKISKLTLIYVKLCAMHPAKSFLLNVKNFNGYYGCNSCEVKGKSSDSKMCFLSTNAALRTNESFRNKTNKEYHKDDADSPIVQLPINITDVVVLDPMHCVFLGVMKRLLEFWMKGRIGPNTPKDQYIILENNDIVVIQSIHRSYFNNIFKLTVTKFFNVKHNQ